MLYEVITRSVLRRMGDDFPDKVAAVIRKDYEQPIVVNLVSSPLDADRMDYLLRDAYFTGVNYGTIDMDRILRIRITSYNVCYTKLLRTFLPW